MIIIIINRDIVVPRRKKAALRLDFDGFKLSFYIYAEGMTASSSTS
jgi:hypothetical protein